MINLLQRLRSFYIVIAILIFTTGNATSQTDDTTDTTIAIVNGTVLSEFDVNVEVKRIQYQAQAMNKPIDDSMMDQMREKVIQSIINRELLFQQSKAKGVIVEPHEVESNIERIKQDIPPGQMFESLLVEMGVTLDVFADQVSQAVAIQKLLEVEVYPRAEVTEKESRLFYDNNPHFFKKPEEVKASHILIQVDPKASQEEKEEARQKVEQIQEKLKAGEEFAELAKTFSQGPSAVNGGDLGYFDRQKMVKPFADAAFSLKAGQVSDIVETRFGYHLIKLTDRKPKTVYEFEDISDQLSKMLRQRKIQDETLAYLEELKSSAQVQRISQ